MTNDVFIDSSFLFQQKVSNLEMKIKSSEENLKETQLQKERCQLILVICKRNKQQNQDYIRALNYLLNNFKVCIKREKEMIQKRKGEIEILKKMSEQLVNVMGEKLDNNEKMIHQIKKNLEDKIKFDQSVFLSKHLYIFKLN
jgi:hypothetical protein